MSVIPEIKVYKCEFIKNISVFCVNVCVVGRPKRENKVSCFILPGSTVSTSHQLKVRYSSHGKALLLSRELCQ